MWDNNNSMKMLRSAIPLVLILVLPLLFAAGTIRWMAGTVQLYEYDFNKYEISKVTGISNADLKKVAQKMADYLSLGTSSPQVTVQKEEKFFDIYNQREIDHLKDVRGLMLLAFQLQLIGFLLLAICVLLSTFKKGIGWNPLLKGCIWGSAATMILMAGLGFVSITGFDRFFLFFHEVSFSNNLWILDPSKDFLIMMFPSDFFNDAAIFWFASVLIEALVVSIIAWNVMKRMGTSRESSVSTPSIQV